MYGMRIENCRSFSFSIKSRDDSAICQKTSGKKEKGLCGTVQNAVLQGKAMIHTLGEIDVVGDHYG